MSGLQRWIGRLGRACSVMAVCTVVLTSCGDIKPPSLGGGLGGGGSRFEDLIAQAQAAQKAGKTDEAEKNFKDAIAACVKKFGEEDARTATCVGYLAAFYRDKQDWKLAYEQYKRWKTILQTINPSNPDLKTIETDMQHVKEKMKQYGLVPDEVLKRRQEKKEEEAAGLEKLKKPRKKRGEDSKTN